jgi:hypothetical protein
MAPRKPEGIVSDAAKAAAKAAAKKTKQAAAKAAAKKVSAAKAASKAKAKANPKNSYLFGKNILHGSPTSGLKKIKPNVSQKDDYGVNVVWGMNPKGKGSALNTITASRYARGDGSVYVVRVPRSSVKKVDPATKKLVKRKPKDALIVSTKTGKVKKEIKVTSGKGEKKIIKEVNRGLVRSGSRKLDKSNKTKQPKQKQQTDF